MADLVHAATLWQCGERAAAEREVLAVLQARPDEPGALRALAEMYGASGRTADALRLWRRLAAVATTDAAVHRQLGHTLLAVGAVAEAIRTLHVALSLEPHNVRALNNLGLALLRGGDAPGAAIALQQAVSLDPGYALGHLNLGTARRQHGDLAAARASFERALQIDPHLVQARAQLGALLSGTDPAAARHERERALESLAINLMTVRRHDDAIPIWNQLIESGANLANLTGMRFHCRLQCCDWSEYRQTADSLEAAVLDGKPVDLPFSFFVYSESAAAQLRCARTHANSRFPAAAQALPRRALPGSESARLRIAYLSFDFHEHATAYLLAGVLERHDRARYEITALSFGQNDLSPMRARLEAAVERFIDVSGRTELEIAELLQELGIQIAIDLKGYTGGARTGIFAYRAAPLQINFLGYPGTLGAEYYDYVIADRIVIPERDRVHYSEHVIEMPDCYQPNDVLRPLPTTAPSRAEFGLPARGFVFCCFNNLYKITPSIFSIWLTLMREVNGSVLWLLEGTAAAMSNLHKIAAEAGLDPARLVFAPHLPLLQHLGRYRHADLFLDTTPCNAHTTASDALWMGVPVITVTGRTFAGRVATSLLHAVDLPQLCTASLADYASLATRLATAPAELTALKSHLEVGRHRFRLFDTAAYTQHLEAAYSAIWERHSRHETPTTLQIGPLSAGASRVDQR